MNTSYKYLRLILLLVIMIAGLNVVGQQLHQANTFELNTSYSNPGGTCCSYIYEARDYVKLQVGFSYTPSQTITFIGRINENLITHLEYQTPTPADENIDQSLVVGSTPGYVDVSPSGAASYTIPIFCPPGTAGMQPQLSINYSSQSGMGLLGMRWDIGGLSAITLTGKTWFYDQKVTAPNTVNYDEFALDGNRLVLTNGSSYGTPNPSTIYGTETDNFSKIVFKNNPSNVPYFTVYTKDGMEMEYGFTEDSRVDDANGRTIIWKLNKVKDLNSNYMLYKYRKVTTVDVTPGETGNGQSVLDCIEYTGNENTGMTPYNKIKFQYSIKQDKNTLFVADVAIPQVLILNKISVECEGEKVKDYDFQYTLYNNLHTRLYKIFEYGNDGSHYNPTRIKWGDPLTTQLSSNDNTFNNQMPGDPSNIVYKTITGDFNNDGKTDVLIVSPSNVSISGQNWQWSLYFGSNNGFVFNKKGYCQDYFVDVFAIDADNDGAQEVYFETSPTNPNGPTPINVVRFFYYDYFNNDFVHDFSGYFEVISAVSLYLQAGDFIGNGKNQILVQNEIGTIVETFIPSFAGGGGINKNVFPIGCPIYGYGSGTYIFDFNGDGKTEVLGLYSDHFQIFEYNVISGAFYQVISMQFGSDAADLYPGDYNGDGKTDLLVHLKALDTWNVLYSTGTGFDQVAGTNPVGNQLNAKPTPCPTTYVKKNIFVQDYNGDGKSDIMVEYVPSNYTSLSQFDAYYKVFYAGKYYYNLSAHIYATTFDTYNEYFYTPAVSLNNFDPHRFNFGDYNGDGQQDLLWECCGNHIQKSIFTHNETNDYLIKTIKNGINNYYNFEYESISRDNDYVINIHTGYPTVDFSGQVFVTKKLKTSNGIGGESEIDYKYEGGKINREGLGFLGFSAFNSTNINNNIRSEAAYENRFIGNLGNNHFSKVNTTNKTFFGSTMLLSEKYVIDDHIFRNNGTTFFIYPSTEKTTDYLKGICSRTIYTYNQEGNITNTFTTSYNTPSISSPVLTVTEVNTYSSILGWHIASLLESKIVTTTRTGQSPYTRSVNYTYDYTKGRLISKVNDQNTPLQLDDPGPSANQIVTTNFLNFTPCGQPKKVTVVPTNAAPRSSFVFYDSKYRFIVHSIDPLGQSSASTFDPAFGNPFAETSITGLITTYKYDGFGRVNKKTPPAGIITNSSLAWESSGTPTNAVYYNTVQTPGSPMTQQWYDLLGREIMTKTDGFSSAVSTEKIFNNKGQLAQESESHFTGNPANWTLYTYDDYSRLSSQAYNGLPATTFVYSGCTTTVTNPAGQASSQTIDVTGVAVSAQDNGGSISYSYNSALKPKSITTGGNVYTMQYDSYGRQINMIDPDAGTVEYNYNSLGEITHQADSKGVFDMTYDLLGRMLSKTDQYSKTTSFEYYTSGNGKGQIHTVTGSAPDNFGMSYNYDNFGRVLNYTENLQGTDYTHSLEYDAYGNVSKLTYPSGFAIARSYDANGFLLTISRADNHLLIWQALNMNALGMPTINKFGNNLLMTYGYDAYNLPSGIGAGNLFAGLKYAAGYDFNPITGNLTSRTDYNRNITETFAYDGLNRLNTSSNQILDIAYSSNGNIQTKTDAGIYDYDPTKPHAVSAITPFYNVLSSIPLTQQNITYNVFNKASQIIEGDYQLDIHYGPDEQRKISELYNTNLMTTTTTKFLGDYEEETNGGNTKQIHYIAGNDGLDAIMIRENGTDVMFYVVKDYLGSIVQLLTQGGNISEEYSYDAWGRRRNPTDWTFDNVPTPTLTNRGYTGHEHLDMFGLINMNGRMYDPVVGRMLSPDNNIQSQGFTQSYNRYSYCFNNPLKYTDPSGDIFGTIYTAVWDFATTVLTKGAIDPWNTRKNRQAAWKNFDPTASWSKTNKAWKIDEGLLKTNPNKTFGGRILELASRFTWQLPQTVIGNAYNHITNVFYNRVNSVNYYGGATVTDVDDLIWDFDQAYAVTLGNYITGEGISSNPFEVEDWGDITWGAELLRHEYGHYIQSQRNGFAYIPKYGISSAAGASWTESDAEYRSDTYFSKYYGAAPIFFSYPVNYKPINTKWWEYIIMCPGNFWGIGGYLWGAGIVAVLNINKGR